MPASTLSEILNGAEPSLKNAKRLASHFNVSLDYLVSDNPQPVVFRGNDFQKIFSGIVRITVEQFQPEKKPEKK